MIRRLVWCWLIFPLLAHAYCEPLHGPDAPSVVLGDAGSETILKAYNKLPTSGGVIVVPPGVYGCEQAFWAAGRASVMKNWTLRGVTDSAGNRPIFQCDKGNLIAYGVPLHAADGVTPVPTPMVSAHIDNIEVKGWTRWLNWYNAHRLIVTRSKMDGRYLGAVRTGKGIVKGEMVGQNQDSVTEVCDSEFSGAGGGNTDHPLYIHGGPWVDKGAFAYLRNKCSEAVGSHCVKTTVTGRVVIADSLFLNECKTGQPCGTETLDTLAAARLNLIRNNTFVRGNVDNPTTFIPGMMNTVSNRKTFNRVLTGGMTPPAYPGGAETAPLYKPAYQNVDGSPSADWSPEFWTAAMAAGDVPGNPFLRLTVYDNNTFISRGTPRDAILAVGTYPNTSVPYISDCLTPLPANGWIELSRLVLINNTFAGNWPAAGPVEIRGPNWCGKFPNPPELTKMPIWDLGGNMVTKEAAPQKIAVPDWIKGL